MQNKLTLLILILLTTTTQAIQDSNITIQTYGLEICISADSIDNQICNSTQTLTIDGTQDHNLYFTNKIQIENNATLIDQFTYGLYTPFNILIGATAFLISTLIGIMLIYMIYNVFKM